jgi:hypothetical protein
MHNLKGFGAGRCPAATSFLNSAHMDQPIPTLAPPSPFAYITTQLNSLGLTNIWNFSSHKTFRPVHYPFVAGPTLTVLRLPVPKTNAPVPSIISSVSS